MFEGLFQPVHMLLIVGIALLCFGPSKFTELGKGLGDSIRNFKSALKQSDVTAESASSEDKTKPDMKETP